MKEKQYAKLLVDVTKISTSLDFHNSRITEFASRSSSYCATINNNIDSLAAVLRQASATETPAELIASLDKIKLNLKKDVEQPALDYKKNIDKLEKDLNQRILPLLSNAQPCVFDMNVISRMIEQCKPVLSAIQQQLATCFAAISRSHSKIANLDNELQILDLPDSIERTTKHLEKMALELSGLQVQVSSSPDRNQFRSAFLPLSAALSKLRLQGESLVEEPIVDVGVGPRARPGPSLDI